MTEEEKKIALDYPAIYMEGFSEILLALSAAEEDGAGRFEKGLWLLSEAAGYLAGQFREGLTGFNEKIS